MWLSRLKVENFRSIRHLDLALPRGLVVLIGENNAGKSAIIDALRLLLYSGRDADGARITENDYRIGEESPIEVSCTFAGLSEADEARFVECLVLHDSGPPEARLNLRAVWNNSTRRSKVRTWGGQHEGPSLSADHYEFIDAVYLQPLRDPERGLRAGHSSLPSKLLHRLTPQSEHGMFETVASDANENMRRLPSMARAVDDLNRQVRQLVGEELAQEAGLAFVKPQFKRIVAGLQMEADHLPFEFNGLGANNILFTAATLAALQEGELSSYRCLLVEEPEAHLHPQMQVLLLRYLSEAVRGNGREVQAIVTSHSPVLASQAAVESMVVVAGEGRDTQVVPLGSIGPSGQARRKLERYLDATRSELFFAKRILFVEGIAEALVVPALARCVGHDLQKAAVSVVNVEGLNFDAFLPLFREGGLRRRVAILTDGDDRDRVGTPSPTARGLAAEQVNCPDLCVTMSEVTFEHELARASALRPHLLAALRILHPVKAARVETKWSRADSSDDQKADAFLEEFENVSKGRFAQELAGQIEGHALSREDLPAYILAALAHLAPRPGQADAVAT